MKTKRIISFMLVLVLVMSASLSTAFASGLGGPGKGKGPSFVPPGIAKKIFNDIDELPWAREAIEKLFLKGQISGVGNGRFNPKGTVTQIEAIIMSLRVMGWEEEAQAIKKLPKNYKGKKVDSWAVGYVALAYEKGILDEVDMMYFDPKASAKRHEVAKYVIRALGYENEAQKNMKATLPFVDTAAIPQGSIGYVYMVYTLDLMSGSNLKFNPMGTMTRAEMAVVFAKIDDRVDKGIDENAVTGEVFRIDNDRIILKVNDSYNIYEVNKDKVVVYDGSTKIAYSNIKVGDLVKLNFRDSKVVYIEIVKEKEDNKIITRYRGTVANISNVEPRLIAINMKEMVVMFKVINNVKVVFNNGEGSFNEIKMSDDISILVDSENRAREIYVHRNRENTPINITVNGTILYVDNSKLIVQSGDNIYTYNYASNVAVTINGRASTIANLKNGMTVKLLVKDEKIYSIEARDEKIVLEGEIVAISNNQIGFKKTDGTRVTYGLQSDVKVYIPNITNAKVSDLKVGDKALFEIANNLIREIQVIAPVQEIEGTILYVDSTKILVQSDSNIYTYGYDSNVVVTINGRASRISNLKAGMTVKVKVKDAKVTSIDAQDVKVVLEGQITAVANNQITFKKTDGTTVTYGLQSDVKVYIPNIVDAKVTDLAVGDKALFEIANNLIREIQVTKRIEEVEGILVEATTSKIKVKINNEVKEYALESNVDIDIEGAINVITNLKPGMKVTLKLSNNKVYSIYARDNKVTVVGKLEAIIQKAEGSSLLINVNNNLLEYKVSNNAEIKVRNITNPTLNDLPIGINGTFEIVNEVIVKITM